MTATDVCSTIESSSPGVGSSTVTPDDDADIREDKVARTLYVSGAGDVCFVGADGVEDTWTVPANFYIKVCVKRVKETGTSASGIKAIW